MDRSLQSLIELLLRNGFEGSTDELAAKIARYKIGLSAEDELSVVLSWLGRTKLVHALDQLQLPIHSRADYRVPDLLAFFEHGGRSMPALIEVKRSTRTKLVWRADYLRGLISYAQALSLPLLIAWKHFSVWTLCDHSAFEKRRTNWHLPFGKAMRFNLLGILGGDTAIVPEPGVGLELILSKEQLLSRTESADGVQEKWVLRVKDAYLANTSGARLKGRIPHILPLLMSLPLQSSTNSRESELVQRFATDADGGMLFAHQALVNMLSPATEGAEIDWRKQMTKGIGGISSTNWRNAANAAIGAGFVRYVFHQHPEIVPDYLNTAVD